VNIQKMKRERAEVASKAQEVAKEMRAINTAAESRDNKAFTAEEEAKYANLEKDLSALDADISTRDAAIEREERLAEIEKKTAAVAVAAEPEIAVKDPDKFRSLGEFVSAVMLSRSSPNVEKRLTSLGTPGQAGYLVPPEFIRELRKVDPESTIVRDRAWIIPPGDSPGATTYIPALDQSGNNGVYGGVVMNWLAENAARPSAGGVKVQQITLTPNFIGGYMDISNALLGNYDAITSYAQNQMSQAVANAEEKSFLVGTGVGQPTGFVGHPCNVLVNRGTANTITYNDIVKMLSLRLSGFGYAWIASRSAFSQIVSLKDTAGNLIWQPNAREASPGVLFGIPVLFSERVPTLGAKGDLVLANLQNYAIKDGLPISILVDPYTQGITNATRIIINWSVDAKPMLTTPIKGEDGIARSAFVTLDVPA
jgi:HK97 family phage major capsid protein